MAMNIPAPVQILRGTKAEIAERTGKMGELNWAEDANELYMHDGTTKGGHLIGGGIYTAGGGIKIDEDGVISVNAMGDFAGYNTRLFDGKLFGIAEDTDEDIDSLVTNINNMRSYYRVGLHNAGTRPFSDRFIMIVLGLTQIAV